MVPRSEAGFPSAFGGNRRRPRPQLRHRTVHGEHFMRTTAGPVTTPAAFFGAGARASVGRRAACVPRPGARRTERPAVDKPAGIETRAVGVTSRSSAPRYQPPPPPSVARARAATNHLQAAIDGEPPATRAPVQPGAGTAAHRRGRRQAYSSRRGSSSRPVGQVAALVPCPSWSSWELACGLVASNRSVGAAGDATRPWGGEAARSARAEQLGVGMLLEAQAR